MTGKFGADYRDAWESFPYALRFLFLCVLHKSSNCFFSSPLLLHLVLDILRAPLPRWYSLRSTGTARQERSVDMVSIICFHVSLSVCDFLPSRRSAVEAGGLIASDWTCWIRCMLSYQVRYDSSFFSLFLFLCLLFFFFFFLLVVCFLRVFRDYHHFYADIVAGSVIGTGMMVVCYFLMYPPLWDAGCKLDVFSSSSSLFYSALFFFFLYLFVYCFYIYVPFRSSAEASCGRRCCRAHRR
jgi:hypothetical protein